MKISKFALLASIAVIASGVAAADMVAPHQKDGLWESSMMMDGKPFISRSCVSEESQAKMSVFSAQSRQKNCSSSSATHNMDGSWSSTSTCNFGGHTRTTRVQITGDFNSKLAMVMYSEGSSTPEMNMTMAWKGSCPPGMKGGDVIANGMKINVIDGTMSGTPH
jgi:Protein of unknown function (DUF3617)